MRIREALVFRLLTPANVALPAPKLQLPASAAAKGLAVAPKGFVAAPKVLVAGPKRRVAGSEAIVFGGLPPQSATIVSSCHLKSYSCRLVAG